ncbi:MAG: hypothetical protein V3U09_05735 [Thermoplasmata archaeon]
MDLMLGFFLSVGLAGIGSGIAAVAMWTAFSSELKKIGDDEERRKMDEELRPKMLVTMTLPTTTIVFALVIYFMASNKELMTDDFFIALTLNIGVSGFIVSISEGYYIRGTMKGVFKYPEHWGKTVASVSLCEFGIIYPLVIAFVSMGKLDVNSTDLIVPNYIVMGASIGSLIAAGLMQRYELKDFQKGILMGIPGIMIILIGFFLAYSYL